MVKKSKRRKGPVKKKRTTLSRYVYLFERIDNKTAFSILKGYREIKIGIGVDPINRNRQVDLGIPGTVVYITSYYVHNAAGVEDDIHDMYEKRNFHVKNAKKGAGGTEFYRLRNRDVDNIMKYLAKLEVDKKSGKRAKQTGDYLEEPVKPAPVVLVTILSGILMLVIQYFKNN